MSAAAPQGAGEPRSAAHMLKRWFENQVRMRPDQVNLRALIDKAINDLGGDPVFQAAILEQGVGLLLPKIAHAHWTAQRQVRNRILTDSSLLPADENIQISERLNRWYEHVGDTIHKRLGAMTRPDLRFAADAREMRVTTELKTIRFERALADRLPNDQIRVDQHFTPTEVAELWSETFELG